RRPTKLRNLLMRLEEAERRGDVEMAVGTIESIRSLPGSPAADLDDALARRLGTLNLRRLFDLRCAQWVKSAEVRRGDSASRIAAENGSTLASLARLNGGDVDRICVGARLYVMDHPRFNLVLHRRTRIADLSLNGKFFKRYDLQDEVKARDGAYEIPERRKGFWEVFGPAFRKSDRFELDMLLPSGASLLVSEL
ncbi:MAG: LysM peptidoglycan-binding domain-containing protein, partial [bacterium]|nr:LysM peptidoglycan-binding domain-containing protein [Candidatus Colisoma equi]